MSPRVYERKFDWNEAKALRNDGWTYAAIAERFSVSRSAIQRVCDEKRKARVAEYGAQWQRNGCCPECGAQATRSNVQHKCMACRVREMATSVRGDMLRCTTCREWKPDEGFCFDKLLTARRGRHCQCRVCLTVARRKHRERNREADNAYQREYKRRVRAADRQRPPI